MTLQSVQLHLRSPLETAARRSSLAGGRTFYKHKLSRPRAHEVKGVRQMRREASFPAGGNDGSDTLFRSGEFRTLTNEGCDTQERPQAARALSYITTVPRQ